MAANRVMGTETEYGIIGDASQVLSTYKGLTGGHKNHSATNDSIIVGLKDEGHFGGDYENQDSNASIAANIGLFPKSIADIFGVRKNSKKFLKQYFGKDDMLPNGARFYIDMGHPEYSTPECSNPISALIADKAGERILEIASDNGRKARIFKNNTDGRQSYGTHENYSMTRLDQNGFAKLAAFMTPFFVSRIVFTGSGKIGFATEKSKEIETGLSSLLSTYSSLKEVASKRLSDLYNRIREGLEELTSNIKEDEMVFHISQRADFFSELIGLNTTYSRPIINTRDEPLAQGQKYMRFHVINGDANMSEVATYMKLGTTSLALDLFEDGKMDALALDSPLKAFHNFSKDFSLKKRAQMADKEEMTAVEIQRKFYEAANAAYKGRDEMSDDILDRWKFILDSLETNPSMLNRQVDWIIKKNLIDSIRERTGKGLADTITRNIDLQYHEVNRQKGLFYMLQSGEHVDQLVKEEHIQHAIDSPPTDTRAYLRGNLIKRGMITDSDWDRADLKNRPEIIIMSEPLGGTQKELGALFEDQSVKDDEVVSELKKRGYITERPQISIPINTKGGKKNGRRKKIRKI